MFTKRGLLRSAAMTALAVTTAKSTPVIAQNKAEWPNLLEAKDIAEEGFIRRGVVANRRFSCCP
jgi:hypothetical protein